MTEQLSIENKLLTKKKLIKFANSFDINDLPDDDECEYFYFHDSEFSSWYDFSEEMKPIHKAFKKILERQI